MAALSMDPTDPPRSWWPHLATPAEVAAIAAGQRESSQWPPPGTHVVPVGHPAPWGLIVEDSLGGAPDDDIRYHVPVGQFVTQIPEFATQIMLRVASLWAGPMALIVATASQWPVVWNSSEDRFMRWIRVTFRGVLGGGVEQFQHKLDLGHPGSDPDLDAAGCAALAEQIGAAYNAQFNLALGEVCTDAHYTEIGAVTMTATSATDSQGQGGNMEQSFPTEWYLWPVGIAPQGNAAAPSLPYEVACAVTLQTDKRGPSGRGRFYLPPFASSKMSAGGLYSGTTVDNVLNATQTLIEWIADNTPYTVIVVSPRRLVLNTVTSISVGKVPDSQRRRRRSQDEARVSALIAA